MASTRLSQHDWIAAGFRTLARAGHTALKAEAIARELKTTKGSFYWHFADVAAYRTAMLDLWESAATEAIIAQLATIPPGKQRLAALIARTQSTPDEYGGPAAEPAIRAWGRFDSQVAQRLVRVDARRIGFLLEDFEALQTRNPKADAQVFYAAFLGVEQLALTLDLEDGADLTHLIAKLLPR